MLLAARSSYIAICTARIAIVRFRDRFRHPTAAGWADAMLNFVCLGSGGAAAGHVCELQLVHSEMAGLYQDDRHRRILTYKDIMFRFHAVDDGLDRDPTRIIRRRITG